MFFLAYQDVHMDSYTGDVKTFNEFRESQIAKLMLADEARSLWIESKFTNLLNKINPLGRMVDRSLKTKSIRQYFADYIRKLVSFVELQLKDRNSPFVDIGYVLCFKKQITDNLLMETKFDLSEFIKKNTSFILGNHSKNMIVVDPGEKQVHTMLHRSHLKPPSFYVHADIEDSYIYLKLHQIVDVTHANGGIAQQSSVFIKDRKILITKIQDQVCEKLWTHIHSLDSKVEYCNNSLMEYSVDFESFKKALTLYIKEKVKLAFNCQCIVRILISRLVIVI